MMRDEQLLERITVDPKVMVGKSIIHGTRLTVEYILNFLRMGQRWKKFFRSMRALPAKIFKLAFCFQPENWKAQNLCR